MAILFCIAIVWMVVIIVLIVIGSFGSNSSAGHLDDRNSFDNGVNSVIDWMI